MTLRQRANKSMRLQIDYKKESDPIPGENPMSRTETKSEKDELKENGNCEYWDVEGEKLVKRKL